jgi:hypothetical protein
VYDTALTVLALDSAGVTAPEPAVSFLWSQQCADGGWDYDATNVGEDAHCQGDPDTDFFASDTNTTALVVMALQGAPIPVAGGQPMPLGPFDFFDAIRDEAHGGWGYTWGFETTDANSTGLVLQAYVSEGVPPPAGSRTALRRLQYGRCGAFAYSWDGDVRMAPDLGATIGAIPGLMGTAFPLGGSVESPAPDVPVCAG